MSEDISNHVTLRPGEQGDVSFIFSSWLKSYRQSEATQGFSNEIYFEGQREVINRVLSRSQVIVACNPDDPSHLYGWVCFEPHAPLPVLHYVYVKQAYRGFGLGRMLLGGMDGQPVIFSHEGSFKEKLSPGSYFNPYKA